MDPETIPDDYYDEFIYETERRRLERDARDCGVILPPEED
jgi:hypothetical protein